MYLVTEYLAGPSVAQVLRESARLPPAQAGDIVRQAALGLQHAHETGVTHGRLSPAAVLLGRPGRGGAERPLVKVSGLGLGRFAVAAGGAGGEPSYRPPEAQAGLAAATPAADVYALGCLFYHLLAGQPPRPAAAPGQMILPIGYVRPDVPGGAAALLADMLGDDSEARPTAEQVAARLAACGDTGNGAAVELNLPPAVTYSPAASILESTACAPRPSGDTSPFDGLTRADDAGDRTPVTVRARATRRTARAFPVAAAVVLLLSAAAVAAALALLVRQALAGR
jgi:serine/threonine-protein kinase